MFGLTSAAFLMVGYAGGLLGLWLGRNLMPTMSTLIGAIPRLWNLVTIDLVLSLLTQAVPLVFAAVLYIGAYGLRAFLEPVVPFFWKGELGLSLAIPVSHTFLVSLAMQPEEAAMPAFSLAVALLLGLKRIARIYPRRPPSVRMLFVISSTAQLACWCALAVGSSVLVSGMST